MSPTLRRRLKQAERRARAPRASSPTSQLLADINAEIAVLADAQIARLWPIMQQATRSLTARLRELSASGKGDTYTAQKVRASLMQTQAAMREMVPRLASELSAGATVMQRAAIEHMRATVEHFSARFGAPAQLDIDMATSLLEGRRALVPQHRRSAERYAGEAWRQIRAELSVAKVEGLSWGETAKRMHGRVEAFSAGYQAERLVRTESVNAYSERVDATAKAEGYDLKWNAASYRACVICGPLDDKVNVGKPPAHPNCRCCVVLWRKDWDA